MASLLLILSAPPPITVLPIFATPPAVMSPVFLRTYLLAFIPPAIATLDPRAPISFATTKEAKIKTIVRTKNVKTAGASGCDAGVKIFPNFSPDACVKPLYPLVTL